MAKMARIKKEKQIVTIMVKLYCRKKEGNPELCTSCQALLDYAYARLDRCPFGENKTTCQKCPIHCYKPAMREKMREVMRFSGPRMLLYHPIAAIRHLFNR